MSESTLTKQPLSLEYFSTPVSATFGLRVRFLTVPFRKLQSILAISNSVNSESPLFRSQADSPSFDRHLVLTRLFRTSFRVPWDFEIAGFDCIQVSFETSWCYTNLWLHCILSRQGYRRVSPFFVPRVLLNMPAGAVSIAFGLQVGTRAPPRDYSRAWHAQSRLLSVVRP